MGILFKPIITEKSSDASELRNCYYFLVRRDSNKLQIKQAVEEYFNVEVKKVRTMNYHVDRIEKFGKKGVQRGKTKYLKKAIVQLSEGSEIDLYSNN